MDVRACFDAAPAVRINPANLPHPNLDSQSGLSLAHSDASLSEATSAGSIFLAYPSIPFQSLLNARSNAAPRLQTRIVTVTSRCVSSQLKSANVANILSPPGA